MIRYASCTLALGLWLGAMSCVEPDVSSISSGLTQTITYVGKQSITDFTGLGQHLQYWPLFGLTSEQTAQRTDAPGCIELTPSFADFKHHYLLPGRTFSNDALGNPIGTKTRGGYANWAMFTLPSGQVGRSGTFYDESNIDNSNNTVNEMKIDVTTLSEFCLNLVTDNTAGEHDPDVRLQARSDTVDLDVAPGDLTFDGQTDMYTFRYQGMQNNDVVKIRMQCSSASGCKGAGLGGIMVSDISTCTPSSGGSDAGPTGDAGADDGGPPDADQAGGGNTPGRAGGCGCEARPHDHGLGVLVPLLAAAVLHRARRRRSATSRPSA